MRKCFGQMLALTGFLLLPFVPGCSVKENGGATTVSPSPSSPSLVGRWRQTGIGTANQSANCPTTLPLAGGSTTSCGANDVIEFHSDGTFTATFSGSDVKGAGTWRLVETNLELIFTAPPSVAGTKRSTTVGFNDGGNILNINAKLVDTPTTETYARE
ncbi:MAG: hypothetical protein GEU77_19670 [Deltaproteobacteria bacterium]|nr:hypothetical protein [Deltaproteobacteria bacterium]